MTEYLDIRCGDDLDPFARDASPLETYAQDIYHGLITAPGTLLQARTWGFGLYRFIGKPLPSTLAADIEAWARRDDRASDARCTIAPTGDPDSYLLTLQVEVDSGFITVALQLTPSGIVRVS